MHPAEHVVHARDGDDPVGDPVAEQAGQREVAEVVRAHVCLEAVGGTGQRKAEHARVVHQHVDGFHRVGELAHAGQVGEVEMGHLDVARHVGCGPLRLRDVARRDQHAVARCGQRRGRLLADAAVAAGDDDSHGAYLTSSQPCVWR